MLHRHLRRHILLALVLALLGALAAPAAAPAAAAPPRCGVSSLLGELRHPTAGAGSRFVTLVLTNVTRHRCALLGYPGLLLLDARNAPLPTNVVRDHGRTPHRVVLAPGASARSQLRFGAIAGPGEPHGGTCERKPARVEVTPPDATRHLVLPWRLGPVCEHGRIEVRPVR